MNRRTLLLGTTAIALAPFMLARQQLYRVPLQLIEDVDQTITIIEHDWKTDMVLVDFDNAMKLLSSGHPLGNTVVKVA
jgi:hypothetical protein